MTTRAPAILYSFSPPSVFASIVELTAVEKGFGKEELEIKFVDLGKAENYSEEFLKISPNGTIPVLLTPIESPKMGSIEFQSRFSTREICQFLANSTLETKKASPSLSSSTQVGVELSNAILDKIGESDPHFLLMSWRTDEERKMKLAGLQGKFLLSRKPVLEEYWKTSVAKNDSESRMKLYESKLAENRELLEIYEGKVDGNDFKSASEAEWKKVDEVLGFLEKHLAKTSYLVGDQLSLADIHAGGWIIRVLATAGGKSLVEASSTLATLGQFPKLHVWLEALVERESFKKIYKHGLH